MIIRKILKKGSAQKNIKSQSRKGSAQIQYKNTAKDMNPLEVLHIKFGHAPEQVRLHILLITC
jgi:hypothetical protein